LCEELAHELSGLGVSFISLDVDHDPELTRLYSEQVPVLLNGREELVRAPFSELSLRQALRVAGLLP